MRFVAKTATSAPHFAPPAYISVPVRETRKRELQKFSKVKSLFDLLPSSTMGLTFEKFNQGATRCHELVRMFPAEILKSQIVLRFTT